MSAIHKFQMGDIVRHDNGPTALCKLVSRHAGGFHAEHCMGGTLFVSNHRPPYLRPATDAELRTWIAKRFERNEPAVEGKAHFIRRSGKWGAYYDSYASFTGCRYRTVAEARAALGVNA